ncbi:MAG: hypothetical protein EI684_05125 [Candidatus Viridilinea halotolerans]|uniref:DUF3168 domain-containing protein n=1 Tax=Candidatus Viridilinea halotolerans TaxID=2491704 RepID=A0A426U5Q5_9CHLR|nr:MAG: hypothetical protein EI684_05125 [Candidatus Viridilinea halotolerans]
MIHDHGILLRQLLMRDAALTDLVGTRIYIATDPPAGYDPNPTATHPTTTGPAVLLTDRGGRPNETSLLLEPTYHARCWGATERLARTVDARLFAALHDRAFGRIRSVRCTVTGQHSPEPETGWHFVLSTWRVTVVLR